MYRGLERFSLYLLAAAAIAGLLAAYSPQARAQDLQQVQAQIAEMQATIKEVLRTRVVPDWIKRAGGAEAERLFNEIIAPLVGFKASS